MKSRFLAYQILNKVIHAKMPLNEAMHMADDNKAKPFIQALCYGVCRNYPRLEVILETYLKKPLGRKDLAIKIILLMGLYQLIEMQVADHAAVYETAAIARRVKKTSAVALINAILRSYLRTHKQQEKTWQESLIYRFAHPLWLINKIKTDWPAHWQQILLANNQLPPMTLRVNENKISRKGYYNKLIQCQYLAKFCEFSPCGIHLLTPVDITKLPDFYAGYVSIQDEAAQLAAEFLAIKPEMSLLDACCAPGGKLLHQLERHKGIQVLALDYDAKRLAKVRENLNRSQLNCELVQQDILNLQSSYQQRQFDRILLDAPCSATGVIRRNPDIKINRCKADILRASQQQLQMLRILWQNLKPQGLLLYVTCSIMPEENEDVITKFVAIEPNVRVKKIDSTSGQNLKYGLQILPGEINMDGFYYCLLVKD
ncbi:MAG: 16S rRNA (cytosine(967)-C(5))-methyltransferase RsmB [Pseudomonadota bacterium]